jgi:hypothetical protein
VVEQLAALQPGFVSERDGQKPERPERLDLDAVLVEPRLAGEVPVRSFGPDEVDVV